MGKYSRCLGCREDGNRASAVGRTCVSTTNPPEAVLSAVVLFGVEAGVLLALVLSLIEHTRRGYHPKNVLPAPDRTGAWQAKPLTTHAQAAPGLLLYRFTHGMYCADSQQLSEEVLDLAARGEPPLPWPCIEASAVGDVDSSAAETLESLHGVRKEKGVHLVVAQVRHDVKEESRIGLGRSFGKGFL